MNTTGPYLNDVGKLAEKLVKDFGALPYEKFAEDTRKIESAVMRVLMMKEGWTLSPNSIRRELVPIDWRLARDYREVGRKSRPSRGS